jgi:hypothetical protein
MLENRIETYWDGRADSYNEHVQKEMACRKKHEQVFHQCGFRKVDIRENISELVHDPMHFSLISK